MNIFIYKVQPNPRPSTIKIHTQDYKKALNEQYNCTLFMSFLLICSITKALFLGGGGGFMERK
jgi:hypothetical protein